LENREGNGEKDSSPHSFKSNNKERIEIVSREEHFLTNEKATCEALGYQQKNNSESSCAGLTAISVLGISIARGDTNVSHDSNSSYDEEE